MQSAPPCGSRRRPPSLCKAPARATIGALAHLAFPCRRACLPSKWRGESVRTLGALISSLAPGNAASIACRMAEAVSSQRLLSGNPGLQ